MIIITHIKGIQFKYYGEIVIWNNGHFINILAEGNVRNEDKNFTCETTVSDSFWIEDIASIEGK